MKEPFPSLHFIHLKNTPIFEQLQLEEALLRGEDKNYCLVNEGSPRAIVMGISGKPEELLNLETVRQEEIPVIKRFSGGGTVIVDENTLFVTLIMNQKDVPIDPFPEPILAWSAHLYSGAWAIPGFALRENDYCIGEKKCGGNAQYIKKGRWLHHTSFLLDFSPQNMNHLQLPTRKPKYRGNRSHSEFLIGLNKVYEGNLIQLLREELVKRFYISEAGPFPSPFSTRSSTQILKI